MARKTARILDKELTFFFYKRVLEPTTNAARVREASIRRAADAMGFDPDDSRERDELLGVLAHTLFPDLLPTRKKGPKAAEERKKLLRCLNQLSDEGVLAKTKSTNALAKTICERFPDEFKKAGHPQDAIRKALKKLIELGFLQKQPAKLA